VQEKRKPTPTKPSDVKRTRRDRRELENIIFKLFEKQPNWALKALVQETDQPEVLSALVSLALLMKFLKQ
jgi:transcription initiation factor TFIIF subunit beta